MSVIYDTLFSFNVPPKDAINFEDDIVNFIYKQPEAELLNLYSLEIGPKFIELNTTPNNEKNNILSSFVIYVPKKNNNIELITSNIIEQCIKEYVTVVVFVWKMKGKYDVSFVRAQRTYLYRRFFSIIDKNNYEFGESYNRSQTVGFITFINDIVKFLHLNSVNYSIDTDTYLDFSFDDVCHEGMFCYYFYKNIIKNE